METHIHNDYVTGGFELARRTGATYLLAAADEVGFDRDPVGDGDERPVGSARRLVALVGDDAAINPTHGFGSFCSSGSAAGGDGSTMGQERVRNDAMVEADEDVFVSRLVAGLTAYPRYYVDMGARNRQGAAAPDLSPPEVVDPDELRARISAGEWVAAPDELRSYPRDSFDDLAVARARGDTPGVVDVRRDDERVSGEIRGSTHIPLHALCAVAWASG